MFFCECTWSVAGLPDVWTQTHHATFLCGNESQSYTIHQVQQLHHAFPLNLDQSMCTEILVILWPALSKLDLWLTLCRNVRDMSSLSYPQELTTQAFDTFVSKPYHWEVYLKWDICSVSCAGLYFHRRRYGFGDGTKGPNSRGSLAGLQDGFWGSTVSCSKLISQRCFNFITQAVLKLTSMAIKGLSEWKALNNQKTTLLLQNFFGSRESKIKFKPKNQLAAVVECPDCMLGRIHLIIKKENEYIFLPWFLHWHLLPVSEESWPFSHFHSDRPRLKECNQAVMTHISINKLSTSIILLVVNQQR